MRYLLFASHGKFSAGLHDTFNMIMGERDNVRHVGLENGMGVPELEAQVREFISVLKPEDDVLVLADIIGGSPMTTTVSLLVEELGADRVRAIGGMSLPMALAAAGAEDESLEEAVAECKEAGADQIKEFVLPTDDDDDDDEDL